MSGEEGFHAGIEEGGEDAAVAAILRVCVREGGVTLEYRDSERALVRHFGGALEAKTLLTCKGQTEESETENVKE